MQDKIPKSWKIVTLEELCLSIETGRRPKGGASGFTNGIPSVSGEHINKNGRFKFENIKYIPQYFAAQLYQGRIENGNILLVKDGATTGKIALVDNNFRYKLAYVNEHIFLIKLAKCINSKYIYWYLWSKIGQELILADFKGTAQGGITRSFASKIFIPLAPQNEQNEIAYSVDSTINKIYETQEYLEKISITIKNFRIQILQNAVTGKLTEEWRKKNLIKESGINIIENIIEKRKKIYHKLLNEYRLSKINRPIKDYDIEYSKHYKIKTWANVKLGNLVFIAGRIGWRGLKASEYTKVGALLLSVYNINRSNGYEVDLTNSNYISNGRFKESPEIQLKNNDILLVKDGGGIGKIGIIKKLTKKATINSSLLIIRGREAFVPEYLLYFLAGPNIQNLVIERTSGSAVPHLFQKDIKEFELSVPPMLEQQEIVKRVKYLYQQTYKIERQYASLKNKLSLLPELIITKAYSGKLTSQNYNDVSIELFLKNLNEERINYNNYQKEQKKIIMLRKSNGGQKMPTKKWKDLLEIIKSHPKGISPEELLSEAQYELKEVADFYKNLKEIQKSIIEVKPNNSKKEWPQKISVIIKAKGE